MVIGVVFMVCGVLYLGWFFTLRGIQYWSIRRWLQQELLAQRTLNHFESVRHRVVEQLCRGQLSAHSPFVQATLSLTERLRERPEQYNQFVQEFIGSLGRHEVYVRNHPSQQKYLEAELALELAHSLDVMCRAYSRSYRVFAWLTDNRQRTQATIPLWVRMHILQSHQFTRARDMQERRERIESFGHSLQAA